MQRSSDTIGTIAAALAKAQCELDNPERTLTATITERGSERSFRYASLASGLDLVRKALGQQDIAVVQSTAVEQGQIMLTTLLVHASGEWLSSLWPVCPTSESSAHLKGAALTYARRYALFTLVGIAGEDDLDAPDIPRKELPGPSTAPSKRGGNGTAHGPPTLDRTGSADLRDQLLGEIAKTEGDEELAIWAKRALPLKNGLTDDDARSVEAAYLAKVNGASKVPIASSAPEIDNAGKHSQPEPKSVASTASKQVTPLTKPVRRRSKSHLALVASQPCLVCQRGPCDPHHLKMAQPRSLGRKVSDEFTVPLCRRHHRELHRNGNERAWWQNQGIDPLPVAAALWERSQPVAAVPSDKARELAEAAIHRRAKLANGPLAGGLRQNDETNPIPRPEV
jgi:hypothetical protein